MTRLRAAAVLVAVAVGTTVAVLSVTVGGLVAVARRAEVELSDLESFPERLGLDPDWEAA